MARSEKKDKRLANRALRRAVSQAIQEDKEIIPEIKDVSNEWSFDKDGKSYFKKATERDMRK